MRALLDTTVLIDHLRGDPAAARYLASLRERPASSELVRIEVIAGLRAAERTAAERLFALIEWISVDEQIVRRAGDLGRRYRASHQGIGVTDLVIAATADQLGAAVATANVKHFPMYPGLQPAYGPA